MQGDADVDIRKATFNGAHEHSTALIGEGTDLLILLQCYAKTSGNQSIVF